MPITLGFYIRNWRPNPNLEPTLTSRLIYKQGNMWLHHSSLYHLWQSHWSRHWLLCRRLYSHIGWEYTTKLEANEHYIKTKCVLDMYVKIHNRNLKICLDAFPWWTGWWAIVWQNQFSGMWGWWYFGTFRMIWEIRTLVQPFIIFIGLFAFCFLHTDCNLFNLQRVYCLWAWLINNCHVNWVDCHPCMSGCGNSISSWSLY